MIFAVIFNKGFAVIKSREAVVGLLYHNSNIEIKTFGLLESAYVYCCQQFIGRWADDDKSVPPPALPRLDELLRAGGVYFNPLACQNPDLPRPIYRLTRYFSVVSGFAWVYLDNIDFLAEYILQFDFTYVHVCELGTFNKALECARREYMVRHLAMAAYLTAPLRVPETLQVNEVFCDDSQGLLTRLPTDVRGFLE